MLYRSGPLVTSFLALSLLCLASGNSAAVLAATGLQRDAARQPPQHTTFQDEMQAWSPVLANIAVLIVAVVHCLVCVVSICQVSRRVCPCLRPRRPYDHNQFDPAFKVQQCDASTGISIQIKAHEILSQDMAKARTRRSKYLE
ncbi:PREDICTED: uncharacterized protein LOC106106912 [Papilio polytes]|uniref:uncharacterized protein LOC106106912 n=1 Tax=Papilio polytes TaxID=76194 RepID=UPI000675C958|nr:PREDICTED: uncharacterized protein LOC106106912 [Papilio polytes]